MKKLIYSLCVLGLTLGSALAQGAGGTKHTAGFFIAGGGNLFVTNNGTVTFNGANIVYLNSLGTSNIQSGAPYFTNTIIQPSGTTVSNILYYGQAIKDISIWPDASGDVAPLTVWATINNPTFIGGGDNQNAGPGTNFPGLFFPTGATNTQTLTFTFEKVLWGTNADTSTSNQFAFSVTCNGTNFVTMSTNLPTAFVQGAKGIRLQSVASTSAANAPGNTLNQVGVSGWTP